MSIQLDALVEVIKNVVTAAVSGVDAKQRIGDNKVVILIDKEQVKTKIVVPAIREKKPSRLAPEFIRRIQEVKKTLKGKRDSIYLFTLLMSLHSELQKMKMDKLDIQSRDIIVPAMDVVGKDLLKLGEVK